MGIDLSGHPRDWSRTCHRCSARGSGSRWPGSCLAGVLLALDGPARLRTGLREVAAAALTGMLSLVGGIGLLTVAERDAPSGLAALVIASVPLWVLVLRAALGDPPRPRTIASVGVGLVGVGLVIVAGSSVDARPSALAILVLAAVLTALGAVLSNRLSMPSDPSSRRRSKCWWPAPP